MNLTISRNVENNKFETLIAFESFGGMDITPEQEQELIGNYPIVLDTNDITFSGKFEVVNGEVIKVADDSLTGETVTLVIPKRIVSIDNLLQMRYEITVSQIMDSELGTLLTTKEQVCQAKVKLFEDKVIDKIKAMITELKTKDNSFESESPINITV